jgi:very-short-patch-repair endonuclease
VGPFEHGIHVEKVPRARAIADAARDGVIGRAELFALGVDRGSISWSLKTGSLHLLYPGVYAVGHTKLTRRGRWRAAVLACGPGACLSHRDAAALHDIRQNSRRAIDVTAPGRSRHNRAGISIHRPRFLHPDDVTIGDGIPVTTLARTLLDLAEVVSPTHLRRAWDESQRLGLFDLNAVIATCARARGRRGLKHVKVLLAEEADVTHTKSEMQSLFDDMLRHNPQLKRPVQNATLHGREVDGLYEDEHIVIELDSYEFHGRTHRQHERDREKQLYLQKKGYNVVRLTWRMLQDPAQVANDLTQLLLDAA